MMNRFSVFNYKKLPVPLRIDFNKALALRLSFLLTEIKNDDVLCSSAIEEFIISSGECVNSDKVVSDLYANTSGGIQAGSGDQNLYQTILSEYIGCWNDIKQER